MRSKGHYNINLNYTYGKAMGFNGLYDQFNLSNNYGVLPNNRTHLFNAAYSIELGNHTKNKLGASSMVGNSQASRRFRAVPICRVTKTRTLV